MSDFLPAEYEIPKALGSYMKFQDGENKVRILSKPVYGWVDWKDDKPIRFHFGAKPDRPVDPAKEVKHFWAFIVWNYKDKAIQLLEITQSSIQKRIKLLSQDADWGAPYRYDLKINRSGQKLETEYTINPVPHKKIADEIVAAFHAKPCNLEALFINADPWAEYDDKFITPLEDLPF